MIHWTNCSGVFMTIVLSSDEIVIEALLLNLSFINLNAEVNQFIAELECSS